MGLYEGEGLEKLIEGAETAWHRYKGFGILDEHYFAGKEIVELDVLVVVDIRVVGLLKGEVDVESGRYAFVEVRAFVAGFHNAGSSTGDDAKAFIHYFFGDAYCKFVVRIFGLDTR